MASAHRQRARDRARAVLAVAAVAVAAGLAVGAVYHLVGWYVDLILVGAAVAGYAVARLVALGVRRFRLAAPGLAAALAVVGVLGLFAADLALDYGGARRADVERIEQSTSLRLLRVGAGTVDASELLRPPQPLGAWDFLGRQLGFGAGVDPERGGRAVTFGVGALFLLLVEIGLASVLAVVVARGEAREPACSTCGEWLAEHPLGAAAYGLAEPLARAFGRGDLDAAAALLRPPDTREALHLVHLTCPAEHDGRGGVLRLFDRKLDRRGRLRDRHRADLPASAAEIARIADALDCDAAGESDA